MIGHEKILLLGAPASGKTTLAKRLISLKKDFVYFSLDTEVDSLCERYKVTDAAIDIAVHRLMEHIEAQRKVIAELPHHNYISLIELQLLNISNFQLLVTVEASLDTLLKRNSYRTYPVPEQYVSRSEKSISQMVSYLTDQRISRWIRLNSDFMDLDTEVNSVISFLKT